MISTSLSLFQVNVSILCIFVHLNHIYIVYINNLICAGHIVADESQIRNDMKVRKLFLLELDAPPLLSHCR